MTNNIPLTPTTTISRTREILFEKVGKEIVMVNLEKGQYFALDDIATEIWALIEEPITVADLCASLPGCRRRDRLVSYLRPHRRRDL